VLGEMKRERQCTECGIGNSECGVAIALCTPNSTFQTPHSGVWGCPRNCESNGGCVPETVPHYPTELCRRRSARLVAVGRRTVERIPFRAATTLELVALGFDEPGDLPVCVLRSRPRRLLSSPKTSGIRGLRRAWLHSCSRNLSPDSGRRSPNGTSWDPEQPPKPLQR
jgi:hypothetical protein